MTFPLWIALVSSLIAICYGGYLISWLIKLPSGEGKMQGIAIAIQEGANAYLRREYQVISMIGVIIFLALWFFIGLTTAVPSPPPLFVR